MPPQRLHQLHVLVSMVLFAIRTLGCDLCPDGSNITNSNYVLDLTNPIPLKTCNDLVNALAFVDDAADMCITARALSGICGCPVKDGACSICNGSEYITNPKKQLDGLVDLGAVNQSTSASSFGLALTCEIVESGMQVYDAGQSECLALPLDDLRTHCGCSTSFWRVNITECTFCPLGETPAYIDRYVCRDDIACEACAGLQASALQTLRGTEECNKIQRISTACGCPSPPNSCRLCKNGGDVTELGTMIVTPTGEELSCQIFEAQLRRIDANSTECISLDATYSDQCRCEEVRDIVPCKLCPLGEDIPFPDKYIGGIDGNGFDYLEHTCGAIATTVLAVDESTEICKSARILSHLCGCKPANKTVCTICSDGQPMGDPLHKLRFNYGAQQRAYQDFPRQLDFGLIASCELGESFAAWLFEEGSEDCYWNQLVRGPACGCPNTSYIEALIWSQRCSGILSLVGGIFLIFYVLSKPKAKKWSPYNQIILSVSFFDVVSAIAYIMGTSLAPVSSGLPGSIGNDATCAFQAWLYQLGLTAVYYSVVLSLYFLLVVKYDWSERKFVKVSRYVHVSSIGVGLIMAFAVIPFAAPDWRWCYIGTPPTADSWLPGIFFFIIPVAVSILAMTIIMVMFVLHVRTVYNRTKRKSVRSVTQRRSLVSRTFWQSCWFLAVFYTVWPIQFVAYVVPTVPSNYWIYLTAAILGPLQGFLNAIVVFLRDRKSIKQRASGFFKLSKFRFGFSSKAKNGATRMGKTDAPVLLAYPRHQQLADEEVTHLDASSAQREVHQEDGSGESPSNDSE